MRFRYGAPLSIAGGLLAGYSVGIAPRWLRVTRLRLALLELPPEWCGVRIAHLSDFHAGGHGVSLDMLARARRIALAYEPDIVALTGDFHDQGVWVDTRGLYTGWPPRTNVFAVLGNHDWRGGQGHITRLTDELRMGGVCLLRNQATRVNLRGRTAWIAGVDDPHTRRDDLTKALGQAPDDDDVTLLLSHSPSTVTSLPFGRVRLMLAGHTHGGQVRLLPSGHIPFVQHIRRARHLPPQPSLPLARGYHWYAGSAVIISDGLGLSTVRARFRTRPQLILIELASAPEQGVADCGSAERYLTDVSGESRLARWLT